MSLADHIRELREENWQRFMKKYGCGIPSLHLNKAGLLPRYSYKKWKNRRQKEGDETMVVFFPGSTFKIMRGSFEAKDGAVTFNSTLEFNKSVFVIGDKRTTMFTRVKKVLPPTCSIYWVDLGNTYGLNLVYGNHVVHDVVDP
jgi:hypothetical protein